MFCKYFSSPIGSIKLVCNENYLMSVVFTDEENCECRSNEICELTLIQLNEYFSGNRKIFDLPIKMEGTEFQNKVWEKLSEIPYGKTISYSQLAVLIGNPKAQRAVGLANKLNKIPIIIPCHRVIAGNGNLTGYASGIWRKEFLMNLEKKNS